MRVNAPTVTEWQARFWLDEAALGNEGAYALQQACEALPGLLVGVGFACSLLNLCIMSRRD